MTEPTQDLNTGDDVVFQELVDQLSDLNGVVEQLTRLRADNLFRFLSKASRNALLQGLLEKTSNVEDAAKAAFRAAKKIKRERLPDEVADFLLAGNRSAAIAVAPTVTGQAPELGDSAPVGLPADGEEDA